MKTEIIEALALELTKGKIAQKYIDSPTTSKELTSADIWVQTYLESEKQIKDAADKINPPVANVSDIPIFGH